MQVLKNRLVSTILLISAIMLSGCSRQEETADTAGNISESNSVSSPFRKDNLVAWCIVPFDAKKRGPEERARMLETLGITRLAYDWRNEHIVEFDDEIDALNRHGIDLEAFWTPCNADNPLDTPNLQTILDLLKRRNVRTQLWVSLNMDGKEKKTQDEKVAIAASAIGQLADAAEKIGCSVGLYNHGGWFGEPENQVAIIKRLDRPNIGIVYNFHHGHEHIDRFAELVALMRPYLMTLNLNGMKMDGSKILSLGAGDRELGMLEIIRDSGYDGPIGILGHRTDEDVEVVLNENLEGLKKLLERLGDATALQSF
ncbi:sugar phosphate isomerase/epimerase family protein [Gemmatimonadota bacterium]